MSEGRRTKLIEKSDECRREWIRAEKAEARASAQSRRVERLEAALRELQDHYHADSDNDHAYSKDECPLCAKIDAALTSSPGEPNG